MVADSVRVDGKLGTALHVGDERFSVLDAGFDTVSAVALNGVAVVAGAIIRFFAEGDRPRRSGLEEGQDSRGEQDELHDVEWSVGGE